MQFLMYEYLLFFLKLHITNKQHQFPKEGMETY